MCDRLNADQQTKEGPEWQEHINDARAKMNQDLLDAAEDPMTETLTFDMEKTLPLPRISTSIVFYKRQLWLYNVGVHSGKQNKGYCYFWAEGTAGRGSQEVLSCLKEHI